MCFVTPRRVVVKLEEKCPEAIHNITEEDEIEVNVDGIDPKTFHELDRFVRTCMAQSQPKKKKKKTAASSEGAEPKAKKAKT